MSFCFDEPHYKQYQHSIHFNQSHSSCNEYFSIEELIIISDEINSELEKYLHYNINSPIIYIETDDI